MKSLRAGPWGLRSAGQWHLRRVGVALALASVAATSSCWLDPYIDKLPTLQDAATGDAAATQDAAAAPPDSGRGSCKWVESSASGCSLIEVSCNSLSACPYSWMQANSAGSCPQPGTGLDTETCGGMYRWTLVSSQAFAAPGDGQILLTCYYDMSNGLLAGIDSQSPLGCGGPDTYQFGTFPKGCHNDGGVTVQRFSCGN